MKVHTVFGKLIALCLATTLLLTTGCRVREVTVTGTVSNSPQTGTTVRGEVKVVFDFLTSDSYSEQYVAILDSAKQWRPSANGSPKVEVSIFRDGVQTATAEFDIVLDSALSQQITPVDKDTIPYAFVVVDRAAFASFLENNLSGQSSGDISFTFVIPIEQIDCQTSSGKYVNHLRLQDSSGITYYGNFYYLYTAPDYIREPDTGSGCTGGELTILNN